MDNVERDTNEERPRWQKPEIVSEEIATEFVVLGHCNQDLEECQNAPVT